MTKLDELKLRLEIAPAEHGKDALLIQLLTRAEAWAVDFLRCDDISGQLGTDIIVDMAAHDYALLGAEGIRTRSLSGLSESFVPDYPERIMARLRAHRRLAVPS